MSGPNRADRRRDAELGMFAPYGDDSPNRKA